MKKAPVGIFDSGYGGLTVLKEIADTLPQYDFIYLGDNFRAPYGPLDFDTVYQYSLEAVKWFFKQGCPLVILACNTASAKALRTIQQNDLPNIGADKRVLGVIRPTTELIGSFSKTCHVGILATTGTVLSQSYVIEIEKFYPEMIVQQEACPEWVSLVEKGLHDSKFADIPVRTHLQNLLSKDKKIDCILLACTHYPLLLKKIKNFIPDHINVVSQGKIVSQSLKLYLDNHKSIAEKCSKNGKTIFYTTGNKTDFEEHASIFFGKKVEAETITL